MRSFCGGRLLPACPRRSGPSPGASSPASSPTFYPHGTARSRNTQRDDRGKTLAGTAFRFPPSRSEGYIRGSSSSQLLPVLQLVLLHRTSCENTHPNSAGLRRSSAPKHRLRVGAQQRVNSLKVFAKAQVSRGRANLCHIACFRRGAFRWFGLQVTAPVTGSFSTKSCRSGLSRSRTHNDCSLCLRSHLSAHYSPPL